MEVLAYSASSTPSTRSSGEGDHKTQWKSNRYEHDHAQAKVKVAKGPMPEWEKTSMSQKNVNLGAMRVQNAKPQNADGPDSQMHHSEAKICPYTQTDLSNAATKKGGSPPPRLYGLSAHCPDNLTYHSRASSCARTQEYLGDTTPENTISPSPRRYFGESTPEQDTASQIKRVELS